MHGYMILHVIYRLNIPWGLAIFSLCQVSCRRRVHRGVDRIGEVHLVGLRRRNLQSQSQRMLKRPRAYIWRRSRLFRRRRSRLSRRKLALLVLCSIVARRANRALGLAQNATEQSLTMLAPSNSIGTACIVVLPGFTTRDMAAMMPVRSVPRRRCTTRSQEEIRARCA